MNWEAIFWLVAMVVFMIAEGLTVTLVSIWFAVGSLAAILVALVGGGVMTQVFVFLGVSILLLLCLRSVVRRYLNPHLIHTNVDSVVGCEGIVTSDVNNVAALGQVEINGLSWSARSSTGEAIREGVRVRVDKIEGVKVFVSPAEIPAANKQ